MADLTTDAVAATEITAALRRKETLASSIAEVRIGALLKRVTATPTVLDHGGDDAGCTFAGVALSAGDDGDEIEVATEGTAVFTHDDGSQTDANIGDIVVMGTDDNHVRAASTSTYRNAVGVIADVLSSTKVLVYFSAVQAAMFNTTRTRRYGVSLGSFTLEDGTPLTKKAANTCGFLQVSNGSRRISWDVSPTGYEAIAADFPLPDDIDISAVSYLKVCTGKNQNTDTTRTIDCEIYPSGPADVANADICATAAQTVTELEAAAAEKSFTITAATIPAGTRTLTAVLTVGTDLNADDQDIMYVDFVYTSKAPLTLI